jgi:hypothetical protein
MFPQKFSLPDQRHKLHTSDLLHCEKHKIWGNRETICPSLAPFLSLFPSSFFFALTSTHICTYNLSYNEDSQSLSNCIREGVLMMDDKAAIVDDDQSKHGPFESERQKPAPSLLFPILPLHQPLLHEKPMADDDNGKRKQPLKVASAGSLILLQLFSRVLTLFMTQMQVRLTSAEVLGAASIHFELLLGLILTLSREGFRTSLSRSLVTESTRNVSLLPIPIGIAISIVVMSVYTTYLVPIEMVQHPHFTWATTTFSMGAVMELLAEPLYIDALVRLDTLTRVKAEGFAIAAKSAAILASLAYMQNPSTLLPFGIGQMAFGAAFLGVFWISHAGRKGVSQGLRFLWPSRSNGQPLFDRNALWLSFTMTRQNLVKHGLGEGDKLAVARLASLSDQGAYALASNYGE